MYTAQCRSILKLDCFSAWASYCTMVDEAKSPKYYIRCSSLVDIDLLYVTASCRHSLVDIDLLYVTALLHLGTMSFSQLV